METITSGQEWNFDLIEDVYQNIERIAKDKYDLDTYSNQLEVVSAEQMLDAYCMAPDHKLLKNDLRWYESGDIQVNDILLGFDENGPFRTFRQSKVTRVEHDKQELFEVLLSSGKIMRVTKEHGWLIRQKRGTTSQLHWKSTEELIGEDDSQGRNQSCIPKVIDVWDEDKSYDSGWLAGMYDGEGHLLISQKNSLGVVGITQRPTIILDKLINTLKHLNVNYEIYDKHDSDCKSIHLLGKVRDKLKFLGKHRAERLINKIDFDKLGLMKTPDYEEVVSIKSVGIGSIVKITTNTGTFICDGYPMHNCSSGLPIYYPHWSFGEDFVKMSEAYKRGRMNLAYELVINSNPSISYLMEENTMLMQTLVIAHAAFGHNFFFKNNYLFKQWTDADGIIDYLAFAKKYIRDCEEKYGIDAVEEIIDAAHALKMYGIDKYTRPPTISAAEEEKLTKERNDYIQQHLNDLWRTVPTKAADSVASYRERWPEEPQENILYFIEKNAPRLKDWEREIIRIVRMTSQYFYPQYQTKLMNEGTACYFHYKIIHDLHDEGILDEGAMLEFYHSHSGVVFQPEFDNKGYSGFNPYALGFAMMLDIERIANDPTEEDRDWFHQQEWVGSGDGLAAVKWAASNFKDESFIQQFLSPTIIRKFKMFAIHDDENDPKLEVSGIHNKQGYKTVRTALAHQYNYGYILPDIQVYEVDKWGDRSLTLRHSMVNNKPLDADQTIATLKHVARLWKYDIKLISVNDKNETSAVYDISDDEVLFDLYLDDM